MQKLEKQGLILCHSCREPAYFRQVILNFGQWKDKGILVEVFK
jgi:hypothetical protein